MYKITPLVLLFIIAISTSVFAQLEIPFKMEKIHITQFDAPYTTLQIDVTDSELDLDKILISEETEFVNKKKKSIDKESLFPGVMINIEGVIKKGKKQAKYVQVLTKVEDWKVGVEGLLESWDGTVAVIDGNKIKLDKKTEIKGYYKKSKHGKYENGFDAKAWPKMSFENMDQDMLGMFFQVKGTRKKDGFIYANKIELCPNYMAKEDEELQNLINKTLNFDGIHVVPPTAIVSQKFPTVANNLSGGEIGIGGMKLKLIQDLEVQAYANYVGMRVVPENQKALDDDDPSKIDFRFYVIDHPSFNAFAFPNGMIFIHSGLMAMIDNEAQLAAILGHEITHATHEHSRVQNTKPFNLAWLKILTVLIETFFNKDIPDQIKSTSRFVDTAYSGFNSAKDSQDDENQADRVGLVYMKEAGYDPREATVIWKKLSKLTNDPQIIENITKKTTDLLNSPESWSEFNMDAVENVVSEDIVPNLLNSMYSSHPKAVKRYENLNFVIATNYATDELSELEVGKDYFKEVAGRLAKL